MILKTLEQLKAVVPTIIEMDSIDDFMTYLESAELWIKDQVLGSELYDLVNGISFADAQLLKLCRSVIGNHAYWDAIPFLDLIHTNNGFAVISATNKVPASKERVERLREQCLIRRDSEVELLISFLESHIDYHDEWKVSPAYTVMTDCLITTATELKQFGEWDGTRKDFLKLRPRLIHETMTKLEPIISSNYMDELIEKQRDNDATIADKKIITLLKYALGSLVNGNQEAAQKIAADALRYIDNHLSDFPTYASSSEYIARTTGNYTNTQDSPIFTSLY